MECSIELAVDLVNSLGQYSGNEQLTDPAALSAFLEAHKMARGRRPNREDLEQIRTLRSKLRAVFEAGGHEPAAAILNGLMAEAGARPELTNHDGTEWHLHYTPLTTPVASRVAAETAMALSVVIAEGGFERLRTCDGDRCGDVFVDGSRNRSRRFCSPDVCGNRSSVAAYRARRRAEQTVSN
jgi:predicted RNA-binding Zn ribbon-like protein